MLLSLEQVIIAKTVELYQAGYFFLCASDLVLISSAGQAFSDILVRVPLIADAHWLVLGKKR